MAVTNTRPESTWRQEGDGAARRRGEVRYQTAEVAETYDRHRFGGLQGRYNEWRLHRLLTKIMKRVPAGSVVLDVPCGTGRIDNRLLDASLRVVAADLASPMLAVARRKVRPTPSWLGLLRADANHLPLRSRSVDAVFSIRYLHLFDRPGRLTALNEFARVARHWAIVEYRNREKPLRTARRVITHWLTGRPAKKSLADIADELKQCGWVVEDYYFTSWWFSGSVLILARRSS